MTSSIFIKTWKDDVKWLPYCLRSIEMYASGFNEVLIVADTSCLTDVLDVINPLELDVRVEQVDDWDNGYIQQQWVKLIADQYVDSEEILYVDSDCVFHTPFTPESYRRYDLPILLKTPYGNLGDGDAWKSITSDFMGFDVKYEYMRRLPWMYLASTLSNFRRDYPQVQSHLKNMQSREFSEFNVLGAYIDLFEPQNYYISNTEEWFPESVAEQFWSWGGLTDEVMARISQHLKVLQ